MCIIAECNSLFLLRLLLQRHRVQKQRIAVLQMLWRAHCFATRPNPQNYWRAIPPGDHRTWPADCFYQVTPELQPHETHASRATGILAISILMNSFFRRLLIWGWRGKWEPRIISLMFGFDARFCHASEKGRKSRRPWTPVKKPHSLCVDFFLWLPAIKSFTTIISERASLLAL